MEFIPTLEVVELPLPVLILTTTSEEYTAFSTSTLWVYALVVVDCALTLLIVVSSRTPRSKHCLKRRHLHLGRSHSHRTSSPPLPTLYLLPPCCELQVPRL
ncbi:hypothetical protein BDV98DRAFT_199470 [Pterulicium gracile]|uniref:Uncharacterized protein n=1 Tax=Pterulicium gracile TaxID=1884261 RepID=A0A5C3Q9A6_9AGAR|nr:hypothetical protein BDV98DRAFT_199470 [Pterula gracilis]